MVESIVLDTIFMALADTTRRKILDQVSISEMTIGEIASNYALTFAAVSKHIKVLERAGLVTKRRRGKEQLVIIVPEQLDIAHAHIERYASMWQNRYDRLEGIITKQE